MTADPTDEILQHTPLTERHRALGARLIPFAGWLMQKLIERQQRREDA